MKNIPFVPKPWRLTPLVSAVVLCVFAVNFARAANGTASFLDFDNTTAGFGTPLDTTETALVWSTSAAGTATATARPTSTQITIGNAITDFSGATFSINLNGGGNLNGVLINSTN